MGNIKNFLSDRPTRDILSIFVISRLLILFIGYLSSLVIIKGEFFKRPVILHSLLDLFYRWDSGWYISIVKQGYSYIVGRESSAAFFPLFPLVVKALTFVFKNPVITGFIASNVFFILGAFYLYKLILVDYKDYSIAFRAVFYIMIFPSTFFFSVPYTEGLFIFLVTACFYYAVKQKWLAASIFGFFLSLTKVFGVLIAVPLIAEYFLNSGRIKKDILWLLLIPMGLILYMGYTCLRFGDAFAFYHSASAWGVKFAPILTTLADVKRYSLFYRWVFLGTIGITSILIAYLIYFKVRMSYIIYAVSFFIMFLSINILEGIERYIIVLFPLYLSLSLIGTKNRFLDICIILFSTAFLVLFTVLFANGYWFT